MEDGPGVEAAVVAVRWVDFGGSECASGLVAATTMEMLEKARRWSDVQKGLESRRRLLMMSWPN